MVRNVKVRKPWKRQAPRVAFPVTITKPNGETFLVAPTRKRVAKRKPTAKRTPKRVAILPTITAQDVRAIELEERKRKFAESQRAIELEMRGAYN